MATSTRIDAPEATERLKWLNVSDSGSEFDYDLSSAENKNTKRKTETDMRIFASFLLTMNEMRLAETIEPSELDRYLTTFFTVIKKHDGNEYEPASLRGMLCSIERYLRVRNYPKSLTRDIVFMSTRNTLKDRQLVLRELAKNAKKGKQELLTSSSVEKLKQLYNAKEFGPYSPMAVINSLCFAFVVHLKIKKAIDHKQLLWGDIALKTQDSRDYLCYEPVQGRDYFRQRLSNISHYRIYSQSDPSSPTDPVAVYKLYAAKRPSPAMAPDSPFYLGLAVNNQALDQQPQWFKASPMGVNKLNDLVRMIREITGNLAVSVSSSVNSIIENYSATHRSTIESINRNPRCIPSEPQQRLNMAETRNGAKDAVILAESGRDNEFDTNVAHGDRVEATAEDGGSPNADEQNHEDEMLIAGTTVPRQSSLGGIQNSCPTKEQVTEQEQVKQNIRNIFDALGERDRQEIFQWIMESYVHKDISCKNCDKPRQFSINFIWSESDTAVTATVKSAPVEMEPQSIVPVSESNATIISPVSKMFNKHSTPSLQGETVQISERISCNQSVNQKSNAEKQEQDNDIKSTYTSSSQHMNYKRTASDDNDREPKLPRIQRESEDAIYSPATDHNKHDGDTDRRLNGSSEEGNDHTIAKANDPPSTTKMAAGNVKPWFAPWAFDPRLTMYLRQGLVPMYSDCSGFVANGNSVDS